MEDGVQRVILAGGTGLIGQAVAGTLQRQGMEVRILTRGKRDFRFRPARYHWNPLQQVIDTEVFEGADAMILLSGAGIADKPWSRRRKYELMASRVHANRFLAEASKKAGCHYQAVVATSAIGYYGSTGKEPVPETTHPGSGFLAELCVAWEAATREFEPIAQRLVINRIGIVLSGKGGALPKLLRPLSVGLVPVPGSGRQCFPWIHLEDLANLFAFEITGNPLSGPVNAIAPQTVNYYQLARTIRQLVSGKKRILHIPPFLLKLALGGRAGLLLDNTCPDNSKIRYSTFRFQYETLEGALRSIIQKDATRPDKPV